MLAHPLLVLVQEEFYSPTSHLPLPIPMNNQLTTADHIPAESITKGYNVTVEGVSGILSIVDSYEFVITILALCCAYIMGSGFTRLSITVRTLSNFCASIFPMHCRGPLPYVNTLSRSPALLLELMTFSECVLDFCHTYLVCHLSG